MVSQLTLTFRISLRKQDTKKSYKKKMIKDEKIRPITDHLNELFEAISSHEPEQSVGEFVTKFKGLFSMRQYFKMKPIKCEFK